ncbi:hypothetical protein ACRN9F_21535 [Shewanella oncorhynchi]|uniref:hypothetical protein n=1 Tax=Shewanella oncorhynchi TaxID=2726434 RepID=UPI003D792461
MKQILTSTVIAASIVLTGCASTAPSDPSPLVLNKDDSFAMQVLKSGFDYVPFDIKDTVVPDGAYQNAIGYGTSAGLGFLSGGGFGALGGLGMAAIINAGGNPQQDYIQYVAWVPADNLDISDQASIDAYVKEKYFMPALESYIASKHNKHLERPAELISDANGTFKVKGEVCYPVQIGKPDYNGCQMFWTQNTQPVRYATTKEGLPFKPSVNAEKYIVVRITDASYRTAVLLPFLQTDMMYAYMPAMGYKAEQVNRLAPNVAHPEIPYVAGKDPKVSFFIKPQK